MNSIEQLLGQAGRSYAVAPTPETVEADLLRCRIAAEQQHRRRVMWSAAAAGSAAVAVIAAGTVVLAGGTHSVGSNQAGGNSPVVPRQSSVSTNPPPEGSSQTASRSPSVTSSPSGSSSSSVGGSPGGSSSPSVSSSPKGSSSPSVSGSPSGSSSPSVSSSPKGSSSRSGSSSPSGSGSRTKPPAHHVRSSGRLITYTGPQQPVYHIQQIPEGCYIQPPDHHHPIGSLTIARDGDTSSPDGFTGKLVAFLSSDWPQRLPRRGDHVMVNGQPGVIWTGARASLLTYRYPDGRVVQVQAWANIGLSEAQIVQFADGLTVTPAATAGRG